MESSIEEFYRDKTIFLTGFSGFLGQVIAEKLLRCCEVKLIYVLIRNKKGKSWQNRVKETLNHPLFDKLRKEKPDFEEKVIGVEGDMVLPNLGLRPEVIKSLHEAVNIVIHSAAIVTFDDKLSVALKINVRATYFLLELCKQMTQMIAFVYISTAYSNCNQPVIEEKVYKPKISAKDMLNLQDIMDEDLLNGIEKDLITGFPNTYTFTKNLAEDMMKNYEGDLPLVIFRPGIVMPTFKEPCSGWVSNFYGPVGLMYGISMGGIHVFRAKNESFAELVPVDMMVSCLLASVWDIGRNSYQSIPVYNYVPPPTNALTWGTFKTESLAAAQLFPTSKCYWYYSFDFVQDAIKTRVLHFLYHALPALFIDLFLKLGGHRFRLTRLYKMYYRLICALTYFVFNDWTFHDNNVVELWKNMSPVDQETFFFNLQELDWKAYIHTALLGMRFYIAKDDPSTIPYSLKRQKVLKVIHYGFTYTIKGLGLYFLAIMFLNIYSSVIFPMFSN